MKYEFKWGKEITRGFGNSLFIRHELVMTKSRMRIKIAHIYKDKINNKTSYRAVVNLTGIGNYKTIKKAKNKIEEVLEGR